VVEPFFIEIHDVALAVSTYLKEQLFNVKSRRTAPAEFTAAKESAMSILERDQLRSDADQHVPLKSTRAKQ
jgi:hypothetical protein